MAQSSDVLSGAAAAPQATQFAAPDVYELHGRDVSVTYHQTSVGGEPDFTYQDHHRSLHFRGDDIRRVDVADLGTVVSVTLVRSVDTGSTTFSVILPHVNLPAHPGSSVPVTTEGITTVHRLSPVPALNQGQREVYTCLQLTGTASLVVFVDSKGP